MLKKIRNAPLFPFVPFVPLLVASSMLTLNAFILRRLGRIAAALDRMAEERPSLPTPAG
jgi:hypothetical protein